MCIQCGEQDVWYCFLGSKSKQRKVVAIRESGGAETFHVCVCVYACVAREMTSVAGQGAVEGALVSVKLSLSHRRRPTARHAHNRALSCWQRLEDWLTVVCQKLSALWQLKCFKCWSLE